MIDRGDLIGKIRNLRYKYKTTLRKVDLYTRPAGDQPGQRRVFISRRAAYSELYVFSVLRQCGLSDEEVASYLSSISSSVE